MPPSQPWRHIGGERPLVFGGVHGAWDICWTGAGSSGVGRGGGYEKYMEGSSGAGSGCMGPAMPVVCLSSPGAREDLAGQSPSSVFEPVNPVTDVLLPAVSGSCTGLYVAVRGIGGTGASAHVHIADSVPAASLVKCRFRRSAGMWRCRQERTVKPSAQPTLVRTQHLPRKSPAQSR